MYIHMPDPKISAAENLLSILRPDRHYTPLEAKVLDTALLLHMEHGGANLKFISMTGNIREHVNDWHDRDEVAAYIEKIINKEAFDRTDLVYGMGHAVYLFKTLNIPIPYMLGGIVVTFVAKTFIRRTFAVTHVGSARFAWTFRREKISPADKTVAGVMKLRSTLPNLLFGNAAMIATSVAMAVFLSPFAINRYFKKTEDPPQTT